MSPIQHIDGATSRLVLPGSAGVNSVAAGSSHPFAAVMHSAFSAAHTPQSSLNRSTPSSSPVSIASRRQSARSQSSTAADSNGGGDNVSAEAGPDATQGGQVANGNPSAQAANTTDQNFSSSSEASTQISVQGGDSSTLTQGQVTLPVSADEHAVRSSSAVTPNRTSSTTLPASPPTSPSRKAALSEKGASSGGTTVASAAPAVVAHVAVVVTNASAAKTLGSNVAAIRTPQGDGTGSADAIKQQQDARNIEAARMFPGGLILSDREMTGRPNFDQAHELQGTTATPSNDRKPAAGDSASAASATSSSRANQGVGSDGSATGSQTTAPAVASTANNSANGSVDSSADASSSGASTAGTQSTDGNNASTANGGNGSSTHSSNGPGSNNSTAGVATPNSATVKGSEGALASSMPPGAGIANENAAGSSVGSPNSSSVLSASNHTNATGSFAASTANAAATRGTSSDAFMALDSAAAGERGVFLHAAPHQVVVGVTDPALGWVEVRAEHVAGQVTAVLATSSAASHAALTSVLPSMATYLQEHHAGVQQVHVETSFANGQTGTGSQGQSSPQRDGRTGTKNTTVANAGSNRWTEMPLSGESISAIRGTSSMIEGRHFSIHA